MDVKLIENAIRLLDIKVRDGLAHTKTSKDVTRRALQGLSNSATAVVGKGASSSGVCEWVRSFDQNFNIGCVGESGERANGQFKGKELGAKWEFIYCPYCGRKIKEVLP